MRYVLILMLLAWPAHADMFTPVSHQTVAVSGSEAASGPLENATNVVRLTCTAECTVALSATSVSSVASQPTWLPANSPIYLRRSSTSTVYVRVQGSSGTLHLTEGDLYQ